MAKALGRLTAGDPTVRVERHADTGQLVLWCLGEAHADVVLERLRGHRRARRHRAAADRAARDVHRRGAAGTAGWSKQSGGHGQYAVCDVIVTPLPRGSGVQFAEKVVGGAVPSQFIGSVEKGVRAQLGTGLDRTSTSRSSTCWSRWSTASRTASTPPTPRSRPRASLAVKDAAASGEAGAARADRRGRHHRARCARRRGAVGPVRAARPGHRHRAGPDARTVGMERTRRARRGARRRAGALRDHAALADGGHRPLHPPFARLELVPPNVARVAARARGVSRPPLPGVSRCRPARRAAVSSSPET